MVIKVDTRIRDKFKGGTAIINGQTQTFDGGYVRDREVNWFVVHGTMGGDTLNWVANASLKSAQGMDYCRGIALFHYLIDQKGQVTEVLNPEKWCYHSSIGIKDAATIGVELENPSSDNSAPYKEIQYKMLVELYDILRKKYPKMDTILSHNRCKQKVLFEAKGLPAPQWAKKCPGPGFDWDQFRAMIKSSGYKFESDPKKESLWNIN